MLINDLGFLLFRRMRLEQINLINKEIERFNKVLERWREYNDLLEMYQSRPNYMAYVPSPFFCCPTIPKHKAIENIKKLEDLLIYNQEMLELEDMKRQALIKAVLVVFVLCIYAYAMWSISAESVVEFMFMGLGFRVL
ncbi:TPA: hypothetical protein ACNII0_002918 [Acinetobacter baumannii]|uniref:hypothetical protein n=1 Tax=Acinetobacter baumannii TaxID=470 RepID=UPI0013D23B7E|nr:hypothetical protein [Acinetobacter baumannii]HEM6660726.1 hypothetical protein [Acinetobacter baumannii]